MIVSNRDLIFLGIGLVCGTGIGVLSVKKKYEEYANEEIASVKERYSKERKEIVEEAENIASDALTKANYQEKRVEAYKQAMKRYGVEFVENNKASTLAHEIYEEGEDEHPVDSDEEEEDMVEGVVEFEGPSTPFSISQDQFVSEHAEFDKLTITYYIQDDTLVDENDEPFPNPEEVIGDETMMAIRSGVGGENVFYARNKSIACDYEIIRLNEEYSVGGIR